VEAGFPIDIQVDPHDPDRLFANNYGGGNFLSEDGGKTWVVASLGYTGAQVRAIDIAPDNPAWVIVSARSGIFKSFNGGETWQGMIYPEAAGLEWNAVAVDPGQPDHILAANNWMGKIVESWDGGRSWFLADIHLREMEGWREISFAPSHPEIVYAGSGSFFSAGGFDNNIPSSGVYRSVDGGRTWVSANDEHTKNANITDIVVHPFDPSYVLAAAPAEGLFLTRDFGDHWSKIHTLPSEPRPLSVAFNPWDSEEIFVGMELGGLFATMDSGGSWSRRYSGLTPEATVTSIVFSPTNQETLFISTIESGVFISQNGGSDWFEINKGLRTRAVNELAISTDGRHLYAATEGEGVFRLDLSGKEPEMVEVVSIPVEVKEPEETDVVSESKGQETPVISQTPKATNKSEGVLEDNDSILADHGGSVSCFRGLLPLTFIGLILLPVYYYRLRTDQLQ
jgi:photosystem II stability/assembly factor-like uncharacterized protein